MTQGRAAGVSLILAGVAGLLLAADTARALPPLRTLIPFSRVEADPEKSYALTETSGPWMILACTFAGENAVADAQKLALELRSRYRLKSYTHGQLIDNDDPVLGMGVNKYGGPKKMRYAQNQNFEEVAVLIGDFQTVDEPALQKTLEQIKHAHPDCLDPKHGKTSLKFADLREFYRRVTSDEEQKKRGPMGQAFVTRNPLLPQDYFAPQGMDKFIYDLNKDLEFSLLRCPGRFSVRVATFRGNVIIDPKKVAEIERTGKMDSKLEQAEVKAHKLAAVLRAKGYEAYEFHDRYESIVTVGNFDSVGPTRADGKIEINPGILTIMESFGPERRALPGSTSSGMTGLMPRAIGGIMLDIQPIPVEVPRKSIAADYARGSGLLHGF